MTSPEDLLALEREELCLLISRLIAENQQQATEILALRRRIKELERGGNRPAAPFSKNRRKPNPRRSGRKPGEGEFKRRMEPEPTEPVIEVPLELPLSGGESDDEQQQPRCTCGGCVEVQGSERVTITLMPKIEPRVRAYDVATGRCRACGRRWRAQHPDVPPDQTGATAHRVAPEVYATARN
jgi:transposase